VLESLDESIHRHLFHRIGTAEVESALVSHPKVAEAAVAPMPHEIKGQGLYAFITLKDHIEPSEN